MSGARACSPVGRPHATTLEAVAAGWKAVAKRTRTAWTIWSTESIWIFPWQLQASFIVAGGAGTALPWLHNEALESESTSFRALPQAAARGSRFFRRQAAVGHTVCHWSLVNQGSRLIRRPWKGETTTLPRPHVFNVFWFHIIQRTFTLPMFRTRKVCAGTFYLSETHIGRRWFEKSSKIENLSIVPTSTSAVVRTMRARSSTSESTPRSA